jgi:hypothetical protein
MSEFWVVMGALYTVLFKKNAVRNMVGNIAFTGETNGGPLVPFTLPEIEPGILKPQTWQSLEAFAIVMRDLLKGKDRSRETEEHERPAQSPIFYGEEDGSSGGPLLFWFTSKIIDHGMEVFFVGSFCQFGGEIKEWTRRWFRTIGNLPIYNQVD